MLNKLKLVIIGSFLILLSCTTKKENFIIPKDYVGMFGYGSLMSKHFIETSLIEKNYKGPFVKAHLNNHKRSWSFAWPCNIPSPSPDKKYYKDYLLIDKDTIFPKKLIYLNIQKETNSKVNGVLYIVPKSDLPTYDAWELGYERFEATSYIDDYNIVGGPVFAYKALPNFIINPNNDYKENIVEANYYNIIQEALTSWGKEFKTEFIQNTTPLNTEIIKENKKIIWKNPPLEKTKNLKAIFKYDKK